jgi:hypothetical protein
MPSAARRLFDVHGQEIYRSEDVQPNYEYYVSSGENFKDPYKSIQSNDSANQYMKNNLLSLVQTEYSMNSTWTMKGLQMDTVKPKSFKTKRVLSKRLEYVQSSLTQFH